MTRSAIIVLDHYTRGAVWLHWIVAALVLVNLVIGLLHDSLLEGVRGAIPFHMAIGLCVLVLTVARVAWRLVYRPPPPPAKSAAWERAVAGLAHGAFYLLLLALPITGWMLVSRKPVGVAFSWLGVFDVPALPISRAASGAAHSAHGLLGYAMVGLIVLHVCAALRHHFVLRDGTLTRMIPVLARPE